MASKLETLNTREQGAIPKRILDAGRDIYLDRGSRGIRSQAIAKRAGVSETTMFRYFEDVPTLYAHVYDRSWLAINNQLIRSQYENPNFGDAASKLGSEFSTLVDMVDDPDLEKDVSFAFSQYGVPDLFDRSYTSPHQVRFNSHVLALSRQVVEQSQHPYRPEVLAAVVTGFVIVSWKDLTAEPQTLTKADVTKVVNNLIKPTK